MSTIGSSSRVERKRGQCLDKEEGGRGGTDVW